MSNKCISTAMSACYPLRGSYQSHTYTTTSSSQQRLLYEEEGVAKFRLILWREVSKDQFSQYDTVCAMWQVKQPMYA